MEDELIINLVEDADEDSGFRLENAAGSNFRTGLIDSGTQLNVKARLVGVTHGRLASTEDPATLLNFEFRFMASGKRRFKQATVTLQFADSEGVASKDPEVLQVHPNGNFAINKTEREWTSKQGINAGLNVGSHLGGGELGVKWEMEETKKREYYTRLSGKSRVIGRTWGSDNAAIWKLEESKDKNTEGGIPSFMSTAVLLKRVGDSLFTFTINVKTDVDFVGTIRSLAGRERKDPIDPVEIDSKSQAQARSVRSLDPNEFDLTDLDELPKEATRVALVTISDGSSLTG
ncbi:hypothetical protein EV356DRAFT_567974 [Viridothelium virens]|uniref:Uncharacterized protein n=1 Tax=Viridothelium virens TaxID=1048519 RepID=A0A6A6H6F7_VIRVR|nr:hypothetical protein EV356DRAFT_567974 [Viridothelium virens]